MTFFTDYMYGKTDTSPPPIWMMRQAGRYLPEYNKIRQNVPNFLSLCYNPELATEVTLQPIRRYGFDAAILFSDILVIPDALGVDVTFVKGEGPKLVPVRDASALNQLSVAALHTHLAPVYDTVKRIYQSLPSETALIGFAGAPFTLACYMIEGGGSRDFSETRRLMAAEPSWFDQLISLLTEAVADYLVHQCDAGAEVIQLFDSWAGIVPPHSFQRWVTKPAQQIIQQLRRHHPSIPIIGFPKGAGVMGPAYAEETDVAAIGIDQFTPIRWAAKAYPESVILQGNLDPVLLAYDVDSALRETDQLLEIANSRRLIFNLGHGVIQYTPPENVAAVVERVRDASS